MKSGYVKLNLGSCLLLCLCACNPTAPKKYEFEGAWKACGTMDETILVRDALSKEAAENAKNTVPNKPDKNAPPVPTAPPVPNAPKTACAVTVERTAITQCEYQVNGTSKRFAWENAGFIGVQVLTAMAGPITALAGASTTTVSLVAGSTGMASAIGSDAGLVQKAIPAQPKFIVKDLTDNGDAYYTEFYQAAKNNQDFYARLYNATLANCQASPVKSSAYTDPPEDDTTAVPPTSEYPKARR